MKGVDRLADDFDLPGTDVRAEQRGDLRVRNHFLGGLAGKQHEFPSAPPRTHRHHGGGPCRIADLHAMGRQTRFVGGDRINDDPRLLEAVIEQFDPGQAPNEAGPAVGADEESRARAIFSAARRGDRRGCATLIIGGDPGQAVAGQNFEPRTLGEPPAQRRFHRGLMKRVARLPSGQRAATGQIEAHQGPAGGIAKFIGSQRAHLIADLAGDT